LAANLTIGLFLGIYVLTGLEHTERYPFSTFAMYSTARTRSPHKPHRYVLEGTTASGVRVTGLEAPLGIPVFARWQRLLRSRPELEPVVARAVLDHNERIRAVRGEQDPLVEIRIVEITWSIPWPHPEEATELSRKVIFRVGR
jgi:hypothetical protein